MKIIPLLLLLSVCVLQSSAGSHLLQYEFTETENSKLTAGGLLDGELFIYCDSNCRSATPQTDWMQKIRTDDRDYFWTEQKIKMEVDLHRFKDSLNTAKQDQTKGVQWIYGCVLYDDGTERGYWEYSSGGKDSITLELKNGDWTSKPSQRDPTQRKEEIGAPGFQKSFLMTECMSWLEKLNRASTLERKGSRRRRSSEDDGCHPQQVTSPSRATHSLWNFYTAVTPGINFPEFTAVGMVDGEQFVHYDSITREERPKTEWIKKVVGYEAGYWDRQTQILQGLEETFKVNVGTLMKRFNQTTGVHTVQVMYGCELDDDGTKRGFMQHGYDGEDFISLDQKTLTWIAPKQQAVVTKNKWDPIGDAARYNNYLETECIEWLQKYVDYGRSTLERKVSPEVSLFQKDSSSPVVCHATGFFPKKVMISWQKNGEDLHEDVQLRETVPNNDGTFQKRIILTVSPEELKNNKYTCVIQHSSQEEDIVRMFKPDGGIGVIIGAVVALLLLVTVICVGVFIWKKKSGFKPVPPSDGENSSNNS